MKVLVEEMRCGLTTTGEGVVSLYGLDYQLTMIIPGYTAAKIAEARDPRLRADPRKSLTDLLEDDIRRLGVTELTIDRVSGWGVYSASLRVGDHIYDVVPSEGVLLCSLVGAPIYYESGMKGVERQPPGQRPVEEGGQKVM